MASSVNNVVGTSVTIGLNIAVSTLASQAVGAGNTKALGLVLQRSVPINVTESASAQLLNAYCKLYKS